MSTPTTVLVVEDEVNLLQNISSILGLYGFTVLQASNGEQGIALANELPNIIVCDVMMEGLNGFDVITQVRSNPATQHIPFIFLTAWADVNDKEKGLALGAQAYLTKPFVAKDLVKAINEFAR
jgi:CheY-like chemotaxis protein